MRFFGVWTMCLMALWLGGCATARNGRETVHQVSTINALLEGVYDGVETCGALRELGDHGLGTFEALDGEMVVMDGQIYQVRSDGAVRRASDDWLTPFATVTTFEPDFRFVLEGAVDFDSFQREITARLPSPNLFYAARARGTFEYVKTRSVPRQEKPYPPLVEVSRRQPVFEFKQITGDLVGFRCPEFVAGVNVPGWHLHFLDASRASGGHLLEFQTRRLEVEIDLTPTFWMRLPEQGAFLGSAGAVDRSTELREVER